MTGWEDLINEFVLKLKASGKRDKTIKNYVGFVRIFISSINKNPDEITLDDVLRFLYRYSDNPHNLYVTAYALRSFFKLVDLKIEPSKIPLPERLPEREVVIIPEDVIANTVRTLPPRLGAMVALMYELGLRVSELTSLRVKDLNTNEWTCYVRRTKGSVSSVVPIVSEWVKEAVTRYIVTEAPKHPDSYLFPGKGGRQMNTSYVSDTIKRVLEIMGYPNARPHDLRHSRATHLIRKGVDVFYVSKLLGHKILSNTMRYTHLVVEDLRRKLEEVSKKS